MTNEMQVKSYIDALVALKAQIAVLEEQEKQLSETIKSFMSESAISELMSVTGHKALLTPYETNTFNKSKMIAELGQAAYDHFTSTRKQTRFTVS